MTGMLEEKPVRPEGRSDLAAASPDEVGPTGRRFQILGSEIFGLEGLAEQKARVRGRIAEHRLDCVVAVLEIAQPIEDASRLWQRVRPLSPLLKVAAVPLGFVLYRFVTKRTGPLKWKTLLRYLPVVLRGASAGLAPRGAPTP